MDNKGFAVKVYVFGLAMFAILAVFSNFQYDSKQIEQTRHNENRLSSENLILQEEKENLSEELDELKEKLENLKEETEVYKNRHQKLYESADYLVHLEAEGSHVNAFTKKKEAFKTSLSGMIFDFNGKQYILTAGHIRDENETINKITVYFKFDENLAQEARIIGTDNKSDVAVLEFSDPAYHFPGRLARFGNSSDVQIGDEVISLGSPLGLEYTLSVGYLGNKFYDEGNKRTLFIHWATINPGNSGGPLLDNKGEVVAMNILAFSQTFNNFVTPMAGAVAIDNVKAAIVWIFLKDALNKFFRMPHFNFPLN